MIVTVVTLLLCAVWVGAYFVFYREPLPPDRLTHAAKAFMDSLIVENTRLAGCIQYGRPQPVNRSIDIATSLRLMGLDPTKSQHDSAQDPWYVR